MNTNELSLSSSPETDYLKSFIFNLVNNGGPEKEDYHELDAWFAEVHDKLRTGVLSDEELQDLRECFGLAKSSDTVQGFTLVKPHGYAGDFELIERIYDNYFSTNPGLRKWDVYLQSQLSPQAVRNRKYYLKKVITDYVNRTGKTQLRILNLASGPARDILEFYESSNDRCKVYFDCIELDQNAIERARQVCAGYESEVTFIKANVLRYKPVNRYDIIWSSGLFDYFSDTLFQKLFGRFYQHLHEGGEIIIGNFSSANPNRPYMEFFDWKLFHRSPALLRTLATNCKIAAENIKIEKEYTGVNLFLHAIKPEFSSIEGSTRNSCNDFHNAETVNI